MTEYLVFLVKNLSFLQTKTLGAFLLIREIGNRCLVGLFFFIFRMNQQAPRAGTPGFRSPEVLIKCPDQTMGEARYLVAICFPDKSLRKFWYNITSQFFVLSVKAPRVKLG